MNHHSLPTRAARRAALAAALLCPFACGACGRLAAVSSQDGTSGVRDAPIAADAGTSDDAGSGSVQVPFDGGSVDSAGPLTSVDAAPPPETIDGCAPVAPGTALAFNPTAQTQYVTIPDAPRLRLAAALTIEAWVSVGDTGSDCVVCKPFGSTTGDSLALWFQGPLYWGLNAPAPDNALQVNWTSGNSWHHIVATYDGSNQQQLVYVDAVLAGTLTTTEGAPVYDGSPLLIGADTNYGSFSVGFTGSIDEVRIFSTVRTSSQIAADMSGTCSPASDPALVAYYPFNEGSGTTAHDASPNHLDGTLGDPSTPAASPSWVTSTAPF